MLMKNEQDNNEAAETPQTSNPSESQVSKSSQTEENQNIKKVREILFGKNINEYDRRFLQIEEHIGNEISVAQKQNIALYNNLEEYIKAEIKNLNQALDKKQVDSKAELNSLNEVISQVRERLNSFQQNSTEQFRKDYESLVSKNKELLEQLQKEGKFRLENVQSIEREISEIKSILIGQDSTITDLKKSLFQQVFDQSKLLEKRLEEENKGRTVTTTDLRSALDGLSQRLIDFRSDSDRRFDDLTQKVSEHQAAVSTQIPDVIRGLEQRTTENTRSLKVELDEIFSRFNSFNSQTTNDFKEIREQLHNQLKNLRLEVEQQNQLVSQKLRTEQEYQRQKKVDRNSLALLFSELALKLGEDRDEE